MQDEKTKERGQLPSCGTHSYHDPKAQVGKHPQDLFETQEAPSDQIDQHHSMYVYSFIPTTGSDKTLCTSNCPALPKMPSTEHFMF